MSNLLYDRLFGCHHGEQKPFLIFSDGSQQSYDSFLRQTARFANVIQSIGLDVGDRLAAQIEKSAEALAFRIALGDQVFLSEAEPSGKVLISGCEAS